MLRFIIIGLLASAAIGLSGCGGSSEDAAGGAGAASLRTGAITGAENAIGDLSVRDLIPLLTRHGVGPGESGIDLTYAPQVFFEVTGLAPPAEIGSRPTLAFILAQTIHEGDLPGDPPAVFLELENGERVPPYSAPVTAEDPHHRTVRLLFPQPDGWLISSRATGGGDTMRLVVPRHDGTVSGGGIFEWRLPIDFGGGADESESE